MTSKIVVAGALVAAGLSVGVVVATAMQWWVLLAACASALASACLIAALDADRRVRALRSYIRVELSRQGLKSSRRSTPAVTAPPATQDDVTGAVRLLQAQYVGRLDRLQLSVEEAIAELRGSAVPPAAADSREQGAGSVAPDTPTER